MHKFKHNHIFHADVSNYILPPGETIESILDFVCEKWEDITLLAYNSYLKQGRGTTIWLWGSVPGNTGEDFYYLPRHLVEDLVQKHNYSEKALELIDNYHPEEDIALGVCWDTEPGHQMTVHLLVAIIGKGSPKIIYLQSVN